MERDKDRIERLEKRIGDLLHRLLTMRDMAIQEGNELENRLKEVEAENRMLREMWDVAVCPDAHNAGHETTYQCQWCDERNALLVGDDGRGY